MINNYTVIDAHCHIFPEKIAARAIKGLSDFYDLPVLRSGTPDDLLSYGKTCGVDRFIVSSVATSAAQVPGINRFLADAAAQSGEKLIPLGALHPDSADLDQELDFIISSGFHGVKLHADFQRIAIDDPRCYKIYERIEGKLPLLTHTGDDRYHYSNPENLLPVLRAFPKLTVIGAHFGGWSVWTEASEKLAKFENFYVDTCSSFPFLTHERIKQLFAVYSADRILFGADYPMWDIKKELDTLFSLGCSKAELTKILSANAKRVYRFN